MKKKKVLGKGTEVQKEGNLQVFVGKKYKVEMGVMEWNGTVDSKNWQN